jgi:hypothetical protein
MVHLYPTDGHLRSKNSTPAAVQRPSLWSNVYEMQAPVAIPEPYCLDSYLGPTRNP